MNAIVMGGYTRISKQAARKLYDANKPVHICTCRFRPDNMWMPAVEIRHDKEEFTFDNYVNAYEYYNCNKETGKYAAFYTKD